MANHTKTSDDYGKDSLDGTYQQMDIIEFLNCEPPKVVEKMTPLAYEEPIEEAVDDSLVSIPIEYEFENVANSYRLNATRKNCTEYLDPLIERYGLPHDLTYALTTNECGILDSVTNAGGACGPMQIQVASMHGEYFKVPVYENGVLTGEYDEFYVVDANKYGDPTYNGKKALYIQNIEDNFQIGCACLRRCIDKYENLFIAVDAYNKGLYAMEIAANENTINYYKENVNDFSWTSIIPNYYGYGYGDVNYLKHVLQFLEMEGTKNASIDYYYKGEYVSYDLTNTGTVTIEGNLEEMSEGYSR